LTRSAARRGLALIRSPPRTCAPQWLPARFHRHEIAIRNSHLVSHETHIARIAWLVEHWVNDGTDAPVVDVWGSLAVEDGYHRICAAAVRGDRHVHVEVSGDLDLAEDLFGVTIPSPGEPR
jgi:hypothetical protein